MTPPTREEPWTRGKGGGFVMKDGRRAVVRCPECGRENYCMSVTSGVCCWCGHDENPPSRASDPANPSRGENAGRSPGGG